MSRIVGRSLVAFAVALSLPAADIPVARSVEPRSGAPGTVITVKGIFLEKDKVEDVYLTDHRFDLKVKVLEQDAGQMKIRIPPFAKPGRHQFLFLARLSDKTVYLEQPVYIQVEEGPESAATPALEEAVRPSVLAPAPAPEPVKVAAAPELVKVAAAPEPLKVAVAPELVKVAATPEPKKVAAAPELVKVAAAPEPLKVAVAPELVKVAATPEPLKASAAPERTKPTIFNASVEPAPPPDPVPAAGMTTRIEVVKRSAPPYPQVARQMRISGNVSLEVTVSADGKVEKVKVVDGHPLLADSAINSVKSWGFRPATAQGQPVSATIPVVVRFSLP